MREYFEDDIKTEQAFSNNWFKTGLVDCKKKKKN